MAKQSNVAVIAKGSVMDRLVAEIGSGRSEFYMDELARRLGCRSQQVSDALSKMASDGECHVSSKRLPNNRVYTTVRPIHVVSRLWRLALGVGAQ